MEDPILLNTVNFKLRNGKSKFKKKFIGSFRIIERVGKQSYKLQMSNEWSVHNVFRVSLLKRFCEDKVQQVIP